MLTPVLYDLLHFGTIFLIWTVRCSSPSSTHSLFQRVKFFKQSCWKVALNNLLCIQKQNTMPLKQCNNKTIMTQNCWLTCANLPLCVQKYCISQVFRYHTRMCNINCNEIWSVPTDSYLWISVSNSKAQITMSQLSWISGCLISLT
jgi:hypothetical protein